MLRVFAKKTGDKRGEMYLYEAIGDSWFGGITAKAVADSLKAIGAVDVLDVFLNSPGGSVFEGLAIYNMLQRFNAKKVVHVDGIAASIAATVLLAGDERNIASNGMVMIHDPWGMSAGTADEMRKAAESLDKVREVIVDTYVVRTGGKADELSAMMSAETWMNAEDALQHGFATAITGAVQLEAKFPLLDKFAKVPESLRNQATTVDARLAQMAKRVQQQSMRVTS